jgi:hypothetical protein
MGRKRAIVSPGTCYARRRLTIVGREENPRITRRCGLKRNTEIAMNAKPLTVFLGCVGCCVFPCIVMAMSLTYEQQGEFGDPAPLPYRAVVYVLYADLCYTAILISLLKGWRIGVAIFLLPLLVVTAVMVGFADMCFSGNYL